MLTSNLTRDVIIHSRDKTKELLQAILKSANPTSGISQQDPKEDRDLFSNIQQIIQRTIFNTEKNSGHAKEIVYMMRELIFATALKNTKIDEHYPASKWLTEDAIAKAQQERSSENISKELIKLFQLIAPSLMSIIISTFIEPNGDYSTFFVEGISQQFKDAKDNQQKISDAINSRFGGKCQILKQLYFNIVSSFIVKRIPASILRESEPNFLTVNEKLINKFLGFDPDSRSFTKKSKECFDNLVSQLHVDSDNFNETLRPTRSGLFSRFRRQAVTAAITTPQP